MKCFVNGAFVEEEDARVPLMDAGFQHGVGLFETFQVYGGRAFRLDDHLLRLSNSAAELGLAAELDREALTAAVERTIAENGVDRCRVRLTLTAGTLSMLKPQGAADGETHVKVQQTVTVVPQPPTHYDPAYFTDGVTVMVHGPGANPFDPMEGHKTVDYWAKLRALRQAAAAGAAEAVWLNVTNHLACGCVSNVIVVRDGVVLTPIAHGEEKEGALRAPVLPGITRGVVLEFAAEAGMEVQRKMLTVKDMLDADEVCLTNSGWGVLPVVKVEQKKINRGAVGPVVSGWIDQYAAATRGA